MDASKALIIYVQCSRPDSGFDVCATSAGCATARPSTLTPYGFTAVHVRVQATTTCESRAVARPVTDGRRRARVGDERRVRVTYRFRFWLVL